jgi:hypothetical protein
LCFYVNKTKYNQITIFSQTCEPQCNEAKFYFSSITPIVESKGKRSSKLKANKAQGSKLKGGEAGRMGSEKAGRQRKSSRKFATDAHGRTQTGIEGGKEKRSSFVHRFS